MPLWPMLISENRPGHGKFLSSQYCRKNYVGFVTLFQLFQFFVRTADTLDMKALGIFLTLLLYLFPSSVRGDQWPYYGLKDSILTWESKAQGGFALTGNTIAPEDITFFERTPEKDVKGLFSYMALKVFFIDGRAPQTVLVSAYDFRVKSRPLEIGEIVGEVNNTVAQTPQIHTCPLGKSALEARPLEVNAWDRWPRVPPDPPLLRKPAGLTQYEQIRARALKDARTHGPRTCRKNLRDWYKENSVWKNLPKYDRALNVWSLSHQAVDLIRRGRNTDLNPKLTYSALACIVKNESDSFYPESVNYTFCDRERNRWGTPVSSAHGLGQTTSTAFYDLRERKILKPPPYSNDKTVERNYFLQMNRRPRMQMQTMARHLNHLLKNKTLEQAVAAYDQDQQSGYLRKFRQCRECFGRHTTTRDEIEQCMLK